MTSVAEIIAAVKRLPRRDLARFRGWLINYDAAEWNHQLEADVAAGRLDTLIRKAQRDHSAGRTRVL
jgi:hypothetical protein